MEVKCKFCEVKHLMTRFVNRDTASSDWPDISPGQARICGQDLQMPWNGTRVANHNKKKAARHAMYI